MSGDPGFGGPDPNRKWECDVAERLISETPEGISVDWRGYWQRRRSFPVTAALQDILLEKGVLSENPDGNFLVVVNPLQFPRPSLTPVGPFSTSVVTVGSVLFFTKLEYAQEWASSWPDFEAHNYDYYITQLSVSVHSSTVPIPA